jgi:uncharacterized protein (UPF0335 family)
MPDAITMLRDDHDKVMQIFTRYQRSKDPALAEEICDELTVHAAIEEEVIYPVVGSELPDGEELEQHAREEHEEVKEAIAQVQAMGYDDPEVHGVIEPMMHVLQEHVQEEENMFSLMSKTLGQNRIAELGDELAAERQKQMSKIGGATKSAEE